MSFPLPTLAPIVSSAGITIPSYEDIYQSLIASFQLIYGADLYVAPDSQDGQLIAVFAKAIHESNQAAVAVFQSFSPSFAIGAGLSSVVKINGMTRRIASNSTCDVVLVGQFGATISNGIVQDTSNNKWSLPPVVVIPISGTITVTATAIDKGALTAAIGTITKIATPTFGWQSVTNTVVAVPGAPVETDAELRLRQTTSTTIPSESIFEGTLGDVANLPGVLHVKGYENDSNVTDGDGIPAHSIAVVVEGGDSTDIAETIARHKTPGTGTYGTTAIAVYDIFGVPNIINFFRPTIATISVEVTLTALPGYLTGNGDLIKASIAETISSLNIGSDVLISKLYTPANLPGTAAGDTFDISLIRIKKDAGSFGTSNLVINFTEIPECAVSNVTIIII